MLKQIDEWLNEYLNDLRDENLLPSEIDTIHTEQKQDKAFHCLWLHQGLTQNYGGASDTLYTQSKQISNQLPEQKEVRFIFYLCGEKKHNINMIVMLFFGYETMIDYSFYFFLSII